MSLITFEDLNFSGTYRHKIAELTRYFGQYSIETHGYQNVFLGGNSSINDGNTLWVKLSGTSFSSITAEDFGELNLTKLIEGLPTINSLCNQVRNGGYTIISGN